MLHPPISNPLLAFDRLISRIEARQQALTTAGTVPIELAKVLSFKDLNAIYSAVIKLKDKTREELAKLPETKSYAIRFQKCAYTLEESQRILPRTVSITQDVNTAELNLIVDTKSKLANMTADKIPVKDPDAKLMKGHDKKGRIAWRVDSEVPKRFNNMRVKGDVEEYIFARTNEILFAHSLHKTPLGKERFHAPMVGACYTHTSLCTKEDGAQTTVSEYRRGFYSEQAVGDLAEVLSEAVELPANITLAEKDKFALQIAEALEELHYKFGVVHNDLKLQNVLVYWDEQNGYSVKLADFGLSAYLNVTENAGLLRTKRSIATRFYEAPELAYYYADPTTTHYEYFKAEPHSYAYQLQKDIAEKDPSNPVLIEWQQLAEKKMPPSPCVDMWAFGILLDFMYKTEDKHYDGKLDCVPEHIKPIIAGLLSVSRTSRTTSSVAVEQLSKLGKPAPKTSQTSKVSKTKQRIVEDTEIDDLLASVVKKRKGK